MYGLTQNMSYKHCGELASLASAELVQQSGPRLSKAQLSKILTKFTQ
jgi:sugar/nucleoside kinase (ribokinase family)